MSFFFLILQWGCTEKYKPSPGVFSASEQSSCIHCHLNADLLKDVATPIPEPEEPAGEG